MWGRFKKNKNKKIVSTAALSFSIRDHFEIHLQPMQFPYILFRCDTRFTKWWEVLLSHLLCMLWYKEMFSIDNSVPQNISSCIFPLKTSNQSLIYFRLLMQAPVINHTENVSLRAPRGTDPTAQPVQTQPKMGSSNSLCWQKPQLEK